MEDEDDNSGAVVSVGEGRTSSSGVVSSVDVSPGQYVMWERNTGSDASLDGKKYKVVEEKHCIAKW